MGFHKSSDRNKWGAADQAVQHKSSDKIRWFRCVKGVDNGICRATYGKLYPATTVDRDGDLAIVDDSGNPWWVVITASHGLMALGKINDYFEEVIPDD